MKSHIFIPIILILAGGALFLSQTQNNPPSNDPSSLNIQPTAATTLGVEPQTNTRYVAYSDASFTAARGKKRVLFFHAPWCPTCRPADAAFRANTGSIPEDVVLFKTDYDSSTGLKKQYNVTYQHTYVLVDDAGNEVKQCNGGGLDELVANTK